MNTRNLDGDFSNKRQVAEESQISEVALRGQENSYVVDPVKHFGAFASCTICTGLEWIERDVCHCNITVISISHVGFPNNSCPVIT